MIVDWSILLELSFNWYRWKLCAKEDFVLCVK